MNKRVGLELGAHPYTLFGVIPLLQQLQTYSLSVSLLSGTGAGAIAAGLIACEYDAHKYSKAAIEFVNLNLFKRNRMLRSLFSLLFTKKVNLSLYDSNVLDQYLARHFAGVQIENLKIPLILKTTDAFTAEEVVLEKGNLIEALRASCALFPAYSAIKVQDQVLVTGTYSDWHARIKSESNQVDLILSLSLSSTELSHSTNNIEQLYAFFQRSFQILSSNDGYDPKHIVLDFKLPFSYKRIAAQEEAVISSYVHDCLNKHPQFSHLPPSV